MDYFIYKSNKADERLFFIYNLTENYFNFIASVQSSYNSKLNISDLYKQMHHAHHPPQSSTMQYLNILDKCTQIIRQDRIWLRNLIKSNNEEALILFKGLPKIPNMKQLQIKIRKYINRTKQRQKQQQLLRFKENMRLPQFIDEASERRAEREYQYSAQNKSQNRARQPLIQNDHSSNQKSSFVAKWNKYTHYNHPNNFMVQNRSQTSQTSFSVVSQNRQMSKQQWNHNYKPHSFNKNLNGQLLNKLSTNKNKSTSSLRSSNHNQTINFSKERHQDFDNLNLTHHFGGALGQTTNSSNGRNSSKNLKQLENKIYQELRIFQNSRKKNDSNQYLNKNHHSQQSFTNKGFQQSLSNNFVTQQSIEKFHEHQMSTSNLPQTQKLVGISKENIDEILKYKLGNCDFQSYKKQKTLENEQQHDSYMKDTKTSSQKKLYNDGYFPTIQEQTQRDSQSQRYAEQPLRFGVNQQKQQFEDRHKFTFTSFTKSSPNQNNIHKVFDISQNNSGTKPAVKKNAPEFYENQRYYQQQKPTEDNFHQMIYEEPILQKNITDLLYQSAQKKTDFEEQYIESDFHKSIMKSIKKSHELFPNQNYSIESNNITSNDNFSAEKNSEVNLFKSNNQFSLSSNRQPNQITSFQTQSYSSSSKIDESLFTSPELLNECRNFLRKTQQINFENCGLKDLPSSAQKSYESPLQSNQKPIQKQISNSNTIQFPQPITLTESITKDFYERNSGQKINELFQSKSSSLNKGSSIDFQTYSKPLSFLNQNSFKKSQFYQSSSKRQLQHNNILNSSPSKKPEQIQLMNSRNRSSNKKHSEIQDTIAAVPIQPYMGVINNKNELLFSLNNQSNLQKEYQTTEFTNNFDDLSKRSIVNKNIGEIIEFQDVIDTLLQANEGNIEVQATWLKHTLQNTHIFKKQAGLVLTEMLKCFTSSEKTYNIIEIIEKLEAEYKKWTNYQPKKCPSRDIYCLLDIQQKGFISEEDIKNFSEQLEDAQIQNLDQIKQNLLQVFQMADFLSLKRVSYPNLYIIKNEDAFDRLCEHFQQFQFQIEGEEE